MTPYPATAKPLGPKLAAASALALVFALAAPSLVVDEAAARTTSRTAIPRVVIRAPNGIVDEPKRAGTMKVIDPSRRGRRRTNYSGRIGIEIRGFTSQQLFPKKSYALETRTRTGKNRNVSLLGMPKDEDWVLISNYRDKSMLRNIAAYSAARWLGHYEPRTRPVELFVNRRYLGVYVLTEQLKLHKRRVRGRYLLEMVGVGGRDRIRGSRFFQTPMTRSYVVHTDPDGDKLSETRAAEISGFVGEFERVLYGPNFSDPASGYPRYLDVGAAVDFVLLNELFKNLETFRTSTYMYGVSGGKLVLGPLWDFDSAIGNAGGGGDRMDNAAGWWLADAPWAERLYADPGFRAQLVARWRTARRRGLLRHILRTIDRGARQLRVAQARNFRRWRILGEGGIYDPKDPRTGKFIQTYAQEVSYLKWWVTRRARWIDLQIG